MLAALKNFARNIPEHLRELWNLDMECQLLFTNADPVRYPSDGNGEPHFDDNAYLPSLDSLQAFGVTGWDWTNQRSRYLTIDLDSLANHAGGYEQATLDDLVRRVMLIEQAEIVHSKSGKGYHVRLYWGDAAPAANTRAQHIANSLRAFRWLAAQVGGLEEIADAVGVVAWIFHTSSGEQGLELLKRSTAFLPREWDALALPESKDDFSFMEASPLTPKHQNLIDYLTNRGLGTWEDGRLQTHTYSLLLAAEDKTLGIGGTFATIATGKGGKDDRNCFLYPDVNGSWKVYRHGKGTKEHNSWWQTESGYTTTYFAKGKEAKGDAAAVVFSLSQADELFHDPFGNPYVTTTINGVKETLPVTDSRYRFALRIRYRAQTGKIVGAENLKNAVDQIAAEAVQKGKEFPVAIRLAEFNGELFIDLSDRQRRVVKVSRDGFELIDNPPVRFYRNKCQLPLPVPLPGGTLADLRPFVNVEDDDLPLLLGYMVGIFHPHGPYALGQIVGEKGSAKTSLSRFIHDFSDPHLAIGNSLPTDPKDMLVIARSRWLVSFDNLSSLPKKVSDSLAKLVTGSALSSRKLFSDNEESTMTAKRPVLLTSIANVVEASDLLDRTLTLVLPTIPPDRRKTEGAIGQELMREGVRGKIFGYLLGGVVSALANKDKVSLPCMPRMSDFVVWATAAEKGLGLPDLSILTAFERCQSEQSGQVTESQLAQKLIQICKEGFKGTASELSERVRLGMSAKEIGSQVREIAPDLRSGGYKVTFGKTGGARYIELGIT